MTELLNRMYMEKRVTEGLDRQGGTFFMLDLDDFKLVNDTLGHLAGDGVIRSFAELMRRVFPTEAVLGRLGATSSPRGCRAGTTAPPPRPWPTGCWRGAWGSPSSIRSGSAVPSVWPTGPGERGLQRPLPPGRPGPLPGQAGREGGRLLGVEDPAAAR